MPKKMKISKIQHQPKVTYIDTIIPNGQVLHIIVWQTPGTKPLLKALKPGDTIVTDTIATIA